MTRQSENGAGDNNAGGECFLDPAYRLASESPVEAWLAFLGHRWNALIVHHLQQGSKSFGDLLACLPTITRKVLTERLCKLEHAGLVQRGGGARGELYSLTARGEALVSIIRNLERWSRTLPGIEPTR